MTNRKVVKTLRFAVKSSFLCVLIFLPLIMFFGRFTFAFTIPEATCLPFHFVLIDTKDHLIAREEYVSFLSDERIKGFNQPKNIMKMVVGVSNDHIKISNGKVFVNGNFIKELNSEVIVKLGKKIDDYNADYTLAKGELFGIGTTPESYDSAYWGPIHPNQQVNEVHPIF